MQRVPVLLGSVVAVGVIVGAIALDRQRADHPSIEVIFGEEDGLPEQIAEGENLVAAFEIEWTGPVTMRDGEVRVFASRIGDATEDAPTENWPLVCESEFDDVVFRQRVTCPFEAPGPGEFALLLEVSDADDEKIGETFYAHLVVDPSETTAPSSTAA